MWQLLCMSGNTGKNEFHPWIGFKKRDGSTGKAMQLLEKSQGGTSLREGGNFERRYRDFRAMPLHINVHEDRVNHQLGRYVLGIDREPF